MAMIRNTDPWCGEGLKNCFERKGMQYLRKVLIPGYGIFFKLKAFLDALDAGSTWGLARQFSTDAFQIHNSSDRSDPSPAVTYVRGWAWKNRLPAGGSGQVL